MSTRDFLNIGLETTKGSALHALKDEGAAGAFDFARLDLSGVAVDTETFTLGKDVYEVHAILTDTGAESTVQVEAGDGSITFDTAPTIPLVKGAVIRMEAEYMIVLEVNLTGNTSAQVLRGQFGSTAVVHTVANSDTFQAAQLVTGNNLAVPTDDVAAAAFVIDCAAAVTFWNTGFSKGLGGGIGVKVQNGLKVVAFVGPATDEVVFALAANGSVAGVNAETFTNGTLDAAFGGGVEEASQKYSRVLVKAAGTGAIDLVAPFVIDEAFVTIYGADGALIELAANTVTVVGRMLTVSSGGALAAGVTAVVEFYA